MWKSDFINKKQLQRKMIQIKNGRRQKIMPKKEEKLINVAIST